MFMYIYILYHLTESQINVNISFGLPYTVQAYILDN